MRRHWPGTLVGLSMLGLAAPASAATFVAETTFGGHTYQLWDGVRHFLARRSGKCDGTRRVLGSPHGLCRDYSGL